jgi:uncharacterized coiled-coil protein SlyX
MAALSRLTRTLDEQITPAVIEMQQRISDLQDYKAYQTRVQSECENAFQAIQESIKGIEQRLKFMSEHFNEQMNTVQSKIEGISLRLQSVEGAGWWH